MITLHESTIHVAFTVSMVVCKLTPNDAALLSNPGPGQRIFRTDEKGNKITLINEKVVGTHWVIPPW